MGKKKKSIDYKVLNIKIDSPERKGSDVYVSLLEEIHKKRVQGKYYGERNAIVSQLFHSPKNQRILHGFLSSFTVIEGKRWLDTETLEVRQDIEIDSSLCPSLKDISFFFFADYHRMFIPAQGPLSASNIQRFLSEALNSIVDDDESVHVIIEQTNEIIERILKSETLHRLEIQITPTNGDDVSDVLAEQLDQEFKDERIGRVDVQLSTGRSQKGIIKVGNLIKAFLHLAKENGWAKATVFDENENQKTIMTKDHPKTVPVKIEAEDVETALNNYAKITYGKGEKDQ